MSNDDRQEQMATRTRLILALTAYWIRGALYILVIAIVWTFVDPVVDALEGVPVGKYTWIALIGLLFIGPVAAGWIGSKLIKPVMRDWSGTTWEDKLVTELSPGEKRGFRVVLVPWPSPLMTVGIVSDLYDSPDGQGQLASVYFPNTPDPTRGTLRVMKEEILVYTDWTMKDLMRYHMSFGSTAPDLVRPDENTGS